MPEVSVTPEMLELLRESGSTNRSKAFAAQAKIAKALEAPLRQGVLNGDILDGIFERMVLAPGTSPEWPLDLLAPGEEDQFVAYTNPGHGYIPERAVEGDYVKIATYEIASSIDWLLRYAREANWDVIRRATEVLENSFVKKMNNDGWHTILAAAVDRNVLVYDADAAAGQFTKRLISLMKTVMRRNGGGNSTSLNRRKLTDIYLSPEGIEDMRNWGVDQLDEVSRREVHVADDNTGVLARLFSVNMHDLDEFGEGQEYQNYLTSDLGGSLASGDVELVIGLDLSRNDSFVMPVKQEVQIYEDDMLFRQQRAGLFGTAEIGFGILDTRNLIAGSF